MRVVVLHDYDCPLGENGLRVFDEAADALASTPPEARHSHEDKIALAQAWEQLNMTQSCRCGAADEIRKRTAREVEARGA